jgi:hypothetical protein
MIVVSLSTSLNKARKRPAGASDSSIHGVFGDLSFPKAWITAARAGRLTRVNFRNQCIYRHGQPLEETATKEPHPPLGMGHRFGLVGLYRGIIPDYS